METINFSLQILQFQIHLPSKFYLHCIKQRDCTVSCYLTAGNVVVVSLTLGIGKLKIKFVITSKNLEFLSWSNWLIVTFLLHVI